MAGVVALLGPTVVACGSVDVPATRVSGADRAACTTLVKALPEHVSDQPRRTTSGNPLGAAWGDPPIVLRCGVGKPEGYDPFGGCQVVNGLDWFVPNKPFEDPSADVVMTTLGREPAVEVRLPPAYRPPAAAMVDLGDAIKASTRVTKRCS